jgi:glycosyltransferase involved in cell wall biosynthesis
MPIKMRVLVTLSNDLVTDQRVQKVCNSLIEWGHQPILIGRQLTNSLPLPEWSFKAVRMKLFFRSGPLFYAELNIRLFLKLLFSPCDAIHANDLDTLLPAFLVSRIRNKQLVYDTHEYFTEVPELVKRPKVQKIWKRIESNIFPRLSKIVTVNESIASLYEQAYGKKLEVMRNIPRAIQIQKKSRLDLGLPENTFIIILQGNGINIDRGGEEAVIMMHHLEHVLLLIAGSGDVIPELKKYVIEHQLQDKVRFISRMPYSELMTYTACSDLGLALDKNTNINYRFSLPNKVFDYIHAGIPLLASDLIEVRRIIEENKVGLIAQNHQPEHLADLVNELIVDKAMQADFRENCKQASLNLYWENEVLSIQKWYS